MDEFVRLFFTGEALQQTFVSVCNGSNRDTQYKICRVISKMLKTTLCIRLTSVGLAPFRSDITMLVPYTSMSRQQLDFLDRLVQEAEAATASSGGGGGVRYIAMGNEVVVFTVVDSVRVWSDSSGSDNKTPLSHRVFAAAVTPSQTQTAGKARAGSAAQKRMREDEDEASISVYGVPRAGACHWQIDTLNLLKAFVACIFRSTAFTDTAMRYGICDIVVQMVMHEVAVTVDTLREVKKYIDTVCRVAVAVVGGGGEVGGGSKSMVDCNKRA